MTKCFSRAAITFGFAVQMILCVSTAWAQAYKPIPDQGIPERVDPPAVLIGSESGPGMISGSGALASGTVGRNEFVISTGIAVPGGGLFQVWNDRGQLERTFGREGDGPGEAISVSAISRSCPNRIVAADRNRLIMFSPLGEHERTVASAGLGSGIVAVTCDEVSKLLVSATGSSSDSFGRILHSFDTQDDKWTSHFPLFSDSAFTPALDRGWWRWLGKLPDGNTVAVGVDYRIEVIDAESHSVTNRYIRRPNGWPTDVRAHNTDRSRREVGEPGYGVSDAIVGADGLLWVASVFPQEDWRQRLVPHDRFPGVMSVPDLDRGYDSLIEAIDLVTFEVVRSVTIDGMVQKFALPGRVLVHRGDFPFPAFSLLDLR